MQIGLNMSLSGLRTLDPAASVRALFSNDEPGTWFEANDATTLFTDVAGTTPVTAPGDAVALQLDKSQGLTLGPELVTNGTFDTDLSGWTTELISDATFAYSSGQAVLDTGASGENSNFFQNITTVVGKVYTITFDFEVLSASAAVNVRSMNSTGIKTIERYDLSASTGTYSGTFTFVATNTSTRIRCQGLSNLAEIAFDNISVRELKGNHRTQATVAARPLYALHPVGGVRNLLEYTEEFDNAVWTYGGLGNPTFSEVGGEQRVTWTSGPGNVYQEGISPDPLAGETWNAMFRVKVVDLGGASTGDFEIAIRDDAFGDMENRTITLIDDGEFHDYEVSHIFTSPSAGGAYVHFRHKGSGSPVIAFERAQVEKGDLTKYQKVRSFLDVSEEGKARRGRLWYNGTSHFMETGTITPGTDKVQVFAGVRKLSDASGSTLLSSGNIFGSANGGFGVDAPRSSALELGAYAKGTILVQASVDNAIYQAPISGVFTNLFDISGDSISGRWNAIEVYSSTSDLGTGNFLPYVMRFGSYITGINFFNGYEDTSIIRCGPNLDDTTISKVESYVASKTPEPTL
jgi:hypothetical protein